MKGLERRGSSCGPQPRLLNLDQLIYPRRIKAECVTPPFFIFMSQQSVSEVPSPMTTQAPPYCLCSTAAAYESHLCESRECPPVFTPCWVGALQTERLGEMTQINKSLGAPQNASDNLSGINSCASHTGYNYGSSNHLLLKSKLLSKCFFVLFLKMESA